MIKINALTFLFIIQFLLVFLGLTIYLFIHSKKNSQSTQVYEEEIEKLNDMVKTRELKNKELAGVKGMFDEAEQKLDQFMHINGKLKETIVSLVPQTEKSKEIQQMLSAAEITNKELDTCLETLAMESKKLDKEIASYKEEIDSQKKELEKRVQQAEHDAVVADKNKLDVLKDQLERQLKEKTEELEKLEKKHVWLEKEYNSLYDNINEENALS